MIKAGTVRGTPRSVLIGLGAASALAVLFAGLWLHASSRPEPRLLQFVVDVPPDQQVALVNESSVAVSPDGGTLAYVAYNKTSPLPQIFVRPLDSLQARTEAIQGNAPRFSPDGRWLYYRVFDGMMRVSVHGGIPERVTPLTEWQGYAFSPHGDIVFAAAGAIWRVGDRGARIKLAAPDSARGEQSFAAGGFLDDNTLSFWIQRADESLGQTGITTLKGGKYSVVDIPGTRAFGMLGGHILVGTEQGSLLAYPFDLGRRALTGPPVVLLDSIVWIIGGASQLSIGRDGTLAYLRGKRAQSLAIVDRQGAMVAEAPRREAFGRAALSPDGKRVAVVVARNVMGGRNVHTADVWTWDIDAKTMAKFTVDGGGSPAWTADGKRIAFTHNTSPSHADIMWAPTDGSGPAEMLVRIPDSLRLTGFSFAHGGRELLVGTRTSPSAGGDVYTVDLTGSDRTLHPLIATRFDETQAEASPDGQWLAYVSNESGRSDVYVRPYASPVGRIRVSANGGSGPQWLASGSRLAYSAGAHSVVVEITQPRGAITSIVRDSLACDGIRQDIDGRGERIVVEREPVAWRIVVMKNWAQEARKKLRSGGK